MGAILKREIQNYFITPLGYIYLSAFYLIAGFYWFGSSLIYSMTDTSVLFSNLFFVSLFLIPILTMRLFSEEKRQGTALLLFTSPTPVGGVVLGKFFSALLAYLAGLFITVVYALIMSTQGYVEWAVFVCNFLGLLLLGSAFIAVGLLISALTESQLAAAIGSFAAALALYFVDIFGELVPVKWLATVLAKASFYTRYRPFTLGILDIPAVLFFVSITALFLFFTTLALSRRNS